MNAQQLKELCDIPEEFSNGNFWKVGLRIPSGTYITDFSTETRYVRDLSSFAKKKTTKRLYISTKVYNSSNTPSWGILKNIYTLYYSGRKTNREESMLESTVQSSGMNLERGMNPQYLQPAVRLDYQDSNMNYRFQNRGSGLIEADNHEIASFEPEINTMAGMEYGGKKIMLPLFYAAPFGELDESALEAIRKWSGYAPRTKMRLVRAKISKDGYANLALVITTATTVSINLLSPAGMYFLEEIYLDLIGAEKSEFDEYLKNAEFRQIISRIMPAKIREVETIRTNVSNLSQLLTTGYRDLVIGEQKLAGMDEEKIAEEAFANIRAQAEREPLIKYITLSDDGKFKVLLGNLNLTIYNRPGTGFVNSSSHKGTDKIEKIPFGYIKLDVDRGYVQSVIPNIEVPHPHVYGGGRICQGTGATLISQLVGEFNIVGAIQLYLTILQKYNPGSPVNRINGISGYKHSLTSAGVTAKNITEFEKVLVGLNPADFGQTIIYRSKELEEGKIEKPKMERRRKVAVVGQPTIIGDILPNQEDIDEVLRGII